MLGSNIDEYDIETADDIQEALKDLLGGTIKSMMEAEMDEHLGYERYERNDGDNYRNDTKSKVNGKSVTPMLLPPLRQTTVTIIMDKLNSCIICDRQWEAGML